jgi:hypothetical protein
MIIGIGIFSLLAIVSMLQTAIIIIIIIISVEKNYTSL